jgi:hypothetical protein
MKKIIIAGIGCVTAKYLPEALRSAGHEPVFLLDPANYVGESRAALCTATCYPVDVGDPDAVLQLLADTPEITTDAYAITSLFDEVFPLTERIAHSFGLAHPDPSFAKLSAKTEVSRLVPEYSPASIAFHPDDLDRMDFTPLTGLLVLKPSLGTGALGVEHLASADLSVERIRASIAGSGVPDPWGQSWILQQAVAGRLVSLEGFATGTTVSLIGISCRTRIGATEVANLFPADDLLSAAATTRAVSAVHALVARSGFRDGYFHCEFLLGKDSAHLIDANMGRPGGAAIIEQIALAHGVPAGEVLTHAVLLPFTSAVPVPNFRQLGETVPTMSFWYGLERGGVVRSVTPPPNSPCLHTQFAKPGQLVPPVGASDYAWIGMFTGNVADAIRDIDRIAIETDEGISGPCYAVDE